MRGAQPKNAGAADTARDASADGVGAEAFGSNDERAEAGRTPGETGSGARVSNRRAARDEDARASNHRTAQDESARAASALPAALDARILECAERLRRAASVVALTGAGLSVESGIPPFRGPGGLWTRYGEPPLDGYQRFLRDPAAAWRERLHPTAGWALGLAETLAQAKPNAGHFALAALETAGCCDALITQNVDDLHRQAGTRALLEIHGNHFWLRCIECHRRFDPAHFKVDEAALPPHCPHCDGLVKADIVSFGEPIPPRVLRACYQAVARCDVMLVIGTSATVFPAAEFPLEVLRGGGAVIEVNPFESELTPRATCSLRGPATTLLTRLVHHVRASAGAEAKKNSARADGHAPADSSASATNTNPNDSAGTRAASSARTGANASAGDTR